MGLESLVRSAVSIAKGLTSDLQVTVQHEAWIEDSAGYPEPQYAQAVGYEAIVVPGPKPFRTPNGDTIVVDAELYILEPVVPNGAEDRHEPIDPRDRFTLPDGRKHTPIAAPISRTPLDPGSGRPYAHFVGLKAA